MESFTCSFSEVTVTVTQDDDTTDEEFISRLNKLMMFIEYNPERFLEFLKAEIKNGFDIVEVPVSLFENQSEMKTIEDELR